MLKFDAHDIQGSFNVVCLLLGIGSLGMAYTFAQAGPIYGTIGLLVTCIFNIYATICLSKCFLHVPKSIETFSDLGMHLFGKYGRLAVQISQFGTCLIVPIAFLILGGSYLLTPLFANTALDLKPTYWILIMAFALMPAVLIRSLKEAYWVMILGALTALSSVVIAVTETGISEPWNKFEAPPVVLENIFPVFGTYALSYGAALIVPTIQREHPNPKAMTKIIVVSLTLITFLYFTIAVVGYSQFGCSSPSNLLLSMRSGPFNVLALLCMLVHVIIAFAVLLNPVLYFIERTLFQPVSEPEDLEASPGFKPLQSATKRTSFASVAMDPIPVTYTTRQKVQSIALRIAIVAVQTFLALLFQGSFIEVVDFVGATTMTICCIVLPIIFYLKIFHKQLGAPEKAFAVLVVLLCSGIGFYTAVIRMGQAIDTIKGAKMFEAAVSSGGNVTYPYCAAGYDVRIASL